jgi:hypothetical protein
MDCLDTLYIDTKSVLVGKDGVVLFKWCPLKTKTDSIGDILGKNLLGKHLAFEFNCRVPLCNLDVV